MMRARLGAVVLCAALAACGGGSASVPAAPSLPLQQSEAHRGAHPVRVSVRVTIRGGSRHRGKRAHFISPSTNGVLAQVYAASDKQRLHLLGMSVTNVSSGSAACGGQTGYPRSCTVSVPAPPGMDRFYFTTYDAKPVKGGFPKTAHVLGMGSLAQTIVRYAANDLAIYIGGVIAQFGAMPAFASLPADGRQHAYGFVLQPEDFNDNPITAGTRDPYANPIHISLAQTGGSGHATLSLNGGPGASAIVSNYSDDGIVLTYDGLGSPGYGMTVTIAASGVVPQTVRISPLFVSSTSALLARGVLNFYANAQQATLGITELDAPSTTTYTAVATGCAGVATAGPVSGSGASATVVATSGTAASAGGCTIAVSDGSSTVGVPVTNTTTGGGVTVPNVTISEFPIPSANAQAAQLTVGSDGAIWFTESAIAGGKIGRIPTNATAGSGAQISEYPIPTVAGAPYAIAAAPDGALWFAERGNDAIGRIPTNATPGTNSQINEYPLASPFTVPQALIVAGGELWFTDQTATSVGVMNLGGAIDAAIGLTGTAGGGTAVDASGNVWIGTLGGGVLYEVSADRSLVSTMGVPASSRAVSLAFDASGNLWIADAGLHAIDELPAGSTTVRQFPIPGGGSALGLTVGPDGAIWFTDSVRNVIGRMTTASVFAPSAGYAIPTSASTPSQIVNGPDGALWFAEFNGNNIGRVVPSGTTAARRR
jgi:virginiamycin B lyase